MKKIIIAFLFVALLIFSTNAQTTRKSKSTPKAYHSGTYKGGKGSSHKGGTYKNSSTNNHYRKRK
jgi:hypothetical protein